MVKSGVIDTINISDLITHTSLDLVKPCRAQWIILRRNFNRLHDDISRELNAIDWSRIYNAPSIDIKLSIFSRSIMAVFDCHVPISVRCASRSPAP